MKKEFLEFIKNTVPPPEDELVNLADYSHPKLLDTSIPPSFDSPEEVEMYFAKVEMNYMFLNILMKLGLNIDDDDDTEYADRLLMTAVHCQFRMSQMLNSLFRQGKISEDTLFNTKEGLFDLLLEQFGVVEWYTELAAQSAGERKDKCTFGQNDTVDMLTDFLVDTEEVLTHKLSDILMDKLFGSADSSGEDSPGSNT